MDTTSNPNLKPFRDYSEHEVVNLYAHASTANKGTFVSITAAEGNTNVMENGNSPATPHLDAMGGGTLSNVPTRATVMREAVSWRVRSATSADTVLGVMLYDVKENNAYGEKFIFRPKHERIEQQVAVSGEAVPILFRGYIKLNNFSGTPGPNSGAIVNPSVNGSLLVAGYSDGVAFDASTTGTVLGKFLSTEDADGFALFKVEL